MSLSPGGISTAERGGNNWLSLWESLLSAVCCVSLQHGVFINLGDTGPWPPKPICPPRPPGTLPQARCEREIRAESQQNTGLGLQRLSRCPGAWRGGATCVPEACLQGRVELGCPGGGKIGPRLQAWLALWVGGLALYPPSCSGRVRRGWEEAPEVNQGAQRLRKQGQPAKVTWNIVNSIHPIPAGFRLERK